MIAEGLQKASALYLQVDEKIETWCFDGRDQKTFMGQTDAPAHMGVLSWAC